MTDFVGTFQARGIATTFVNSETPENTSRQKLTDTLALNIEMS